MFLVFHIINVKFLYNWDNLYWAISRRVNISVRMDVAFSYFHLRLIDGSNESISFFGESRLPQLQWRCDWLYTTWTLTVVPSPPKGFPVLSSSGWLLSSVIPSPLLTLSSPTVFPQWWCGAVRLSGLWLEQLSPTQRTLLIGSPGAVPLVEQSRAVSVEACRRQPEPMQAFKTQWRSLWAAVLAL